MFPTSSKVLFVTIGATINGCFSQVLRIKLNSEYVAVIIFISSITGSKYGWRSSLFIYFLVSALATVGQLRMTWLGYEIVNVVFNIKCFCTGFGIWSQANLLAYINYILFHCSSTVVVWGLMHQKFCMIIQLNLVRLNCPSDAPAEFRSCICYIYDVYENWTILVHICTNVYNWHCHIW